MFHKILSVFLSFVLFLTFGTTAKVNAEPFTPSGSMQVLNLEECNLSIKYNAEKLLLAPINVQGRSRYFIGSTISNKVFLRASCEQGLISNDSTPARVPFWTGTRPDYTKIKVVSYGFQKSGMIDGSGALLFSIENKNNPDKSIILIYNYNTYDFGNWSDVYNGVFATQAGITSDDLQIKYINDPVYPVDTNQTTTNNTSPTVTQPASTADNTATSQTPLADSTTLNTGGVDLTQKVFTFDSSKYPTCKGKTGKYLNGKGEIIKVSQVPKRASLIKADANGIILSSENDYIHCVKNAKSFGSVSCKNNVGSTLNNRGQKVRQYIRGTVYYASPEFGTMYISPKAGVKCTDNQFQLAKRVFQK